MNNHIFPTAAMLSCFAVILTSGANGQTKKPLHFDPPVATTMDSQASVLPDSDDPWFAWQGEVKVDLDGPEPLAVERQGRIQASDANAARIEGENEFLAMIRSQFADLGRVVPETLRVSISPVASTHDKPALPDHLNVQVFVILACFGSWSFDGVLGNRRIVDDFTVKATVEVNHQTDHMEGVIWNFMRRSNQRTLRFLLWEGPVYLDDKGLPVTVTLSQLRRRVKVGLTVWPEETTKIGKLRIRLRNDNGRLVTTLQPLSATKLVPGPSSNLTKRVIFDGGGNTYRGTMSIRCPAEEKAVQAEREKSIAEHQKLQAERNQASQPRADEPVRVYTAQVNLKFRDHLNNRISYVAFAFPTIVIANDPEAAAAYVKRVFPDGADRVKIFKDLKETEEKLLEECQEQSKRPQFNDTDFIPGAVEIHIKPKNTGFNPDARLFRTGHWQAP